MKRLALLIPVVMLALLAGCVQEAPVQGCQEDAMICPDGSVVVREGPDCEFPACPEMNETQNETLERPDEPVSSVPRNDAPEEPEAVRCEPGQRDVDACIELYQPVCGWFDSDRVQCIRYPCAQTYSNSCFACDNPDVAYYTAGECPA